MGRPRESRTTSNEQATVKTSFNLPESLYRDLRLRALDERRSATMILREVLATYLKTPKKRSKR